MDSQQEKNGGPTLKTLAALWFYTIDMEPTREKEGVRRRKLKRGCADAGVVADKREAQDKWIVYPPGIGKEDNR